MITTASSVEFNKLLSYRTQSTNLKTVASMAVLIIGYGLCTEILMLCSDTSLLIIFYLHFMFSFENYAYYLAMLKRTMYYILLYLQLLCDLPFFLCFSKNSPVSRRFSFFITSLSSFKFTYPYFLKASASFAQGFSEQYFI